MYELIDWMITLPDLEERRLMRQVETYEANTTMPHITSAERIGIEKGIEKGIEQGIERLALAQLERKFGPLDAKRRERVESLPLERFEELALDLLSFQSVGELDAWLNRR